MPPTEKPKVKIKITTRFTDEQGGRLFGPGIWPVDPATSIRLIANGRATLYREPGEAAVLGENKKAPKEPKSPETNPRIPSPKEPEADPISTPLPEGFPCQATLAVAGFDSVESLRVDGIKDKLAEVEGLTPADVTKIGLAISKV